MATLLKPTRPYPLPPNPDIVTKDGKPHVRIAADGKAALYPLSRDGTKYLQTVEEVVWPVHRRRRRGPA